MFTVLCHRGLHWRGAFLIGLLALGLTGSCAWAKNLRIVTIDSAPFGLIAKDGSPAGMMFEIGNLIAKEAGFTATNQIIPYARTIPVVVNGDADFVVRYSDPKLTEGAVPVARVLSLPSIVFGKPSLQLKTLHDLHGKTVGRPRGGWFDDDFETDSAILKYETNNYPQALKMLLNDRFDAVIGSSVGLYYNASTLGITREQLGKPLVLSTRHFELHFSKKTADDTTITALKDAILRLHKRNEIKNIVNRYLSAFDWDLQSK